MVTTRPNGMVIRTTICYAASYTQQQWTWIETSLRRRIVQLEREKYTLCQRVVYHVDTRGTSVEEIATYDKVSTTRITILVEFKCSDFSAKVVRLSDQ